VAPRFPRRVGISVGSEPQSPLACGICESEKSEPLTQVGPERHRPNVNKSPSGSHHRKVDLATIHGSEPQVNSYPASEQRISEVERGRSCSAILPMPFGQTLSAGDSIIFALAYFDACQETCFVKCGDSICVSLTEITDLGATDPATGQSLFRFSWKPLGEGGSPGTSAKRVVKTRSSYGTG
jgi:hypothetical protein